MGQALGTHDWASSPLGLPETWPSALCTSVRLMLNTPIPAFVVWGDALTLLYNDAYAGILFDKHPAALGRSFREVWPEIWSDLEPLVKRAFNGEATTLENMPLRMTRKGYAENTWFTYFYTPISCNDGTVHGFFCGCIETTGRFESGQALEIEKEALQREVVDRTAERDQLKADAALTVFAERIRALSTPQAIALAAAEWVGKSLGLTRAGYGAVDDAQEQLEVTGDWCAPGQQSASGVHRFSDYGSYGDALRRGETVVISDVASDPRSQEKHAAFAALDVGALVNLTLFEHSRLRAIFYLHHRAPHRWTAEELAFAHVILDRAHVEIERTHAEIRLRAEESRFRALITATSYSIYQMSADWQEMRLLEGRGFLTDTDRPSVRWLDLYIDPADRPQVMAAIAKAIAGKELFELEHRVRKLDGTFGWTLSRAVPIFDNQGNILEWFGAASDVTSRHEAEEHLRDLNETLEQRVSERTGDLMRAESALRQSQKMEAVGQLTGGLAHDFNNLLAGISGALELMGARLKQGRIAEVEKFLNSAQGATRRAASLTHRLLAFSRRQTLAPKIIDANQLVTSMVDLVQRTVGPGIHIEMRMATDPWAVLVDVSQLENALLNMCINARDAMPDGGRIVIETSNRQYNGESGLAAGPYLVLSIVDTGTGMSPEVMAKAFDPFFTTKPIGQGTGLGLSMIYGFAKQSGGDVRISSEVGQGTTVELYLPRHHGPLDVDVAHADRLASPQATAAQTVLVVDDEPTVRELVAEVLRELGYQVLEAANSLEGLRILQSNAKIDLLVTDVGLPGGMNGRQMADAARTTRPGLKVLFITGYAENAPVSGGQLETGMSVLTKPFAIDALTERIRDLITR